MITNHPASFPKYWHDDITHLQFSTETKKTKRLELLDYIKSNRRWNKCNVISNMNKTFLLFECFSMEKPKELCYAWPVENLFLYRTCFCIHIELLRAGITNYISKSWRRFSFNSPRTICVQTFFWENEKCPEFVVNLFRLKSDLFSTVSQWHLTSPSLLSQPFTANIEIKQIILLWLNLFFVRC